jgi:hypothetical protein
MPAAQCSMPLHASWSAHSVPSVTGACLHAFADTSHVSVVHALPSSQATGLPPVHTPALHAPPHVALVEQGAPSLPGAVPQPATASQTSALHGLPSSHTSATPAAQAPAWQTSRPLQTLPSEQGTPFVTGTWTQPLAPDPQASAVHGLPSSQEADAPPVHAPD